MPLRRRFLLVAAGAARPAFLGASTALRAYGLTRPAQWPPITLAGGRMFFALQSVQWTPLFAAAVLLPALQVSGP